MSFLAVIFYDIFWIEVRFDLGGGPSFWWGVPNLLSCHRPRPKHSFGESGHESIGLNKEHCGKARACTARSTASSYPDNVIPHPNSSLYVFTPPISILAAITHFYNEQKTTNKAFYEHKTRPSLFLFLPLFWAWSWLQPGIPANFRFFVFLAMRFKATISNSASLTSILQVLICWFLVQKCIVCIKRSTKNLYVIKVLEKLGQTCMVHLQPKIVSFYLTTQFSQSGQCFVELAVPAIFEDYRIESRSENEIPMLVNIPNLVRALRSSVTSAFVEPQLNWFRNVHLKLSSS